MNLSLFSMSLRSTVRRALGAAIVALLMCSANSAFALEPVPDFYQEPGLSPNRDTLSQQIHEHIDPFTGKLQIHQVDLSLPGNGGLDINVQRSYSSINDSLQDVESTAFGVGWTMHFGRVLRNVTPHAFRQN